MTAAAGAPPRRAARTVWPFLLLTIATPLLHLIQLPRGVVALVFLGSAHSLITVLVAVTAGAIFAIKGEYDDAHRALPIGTTRARPIWPYLLYVLGAAALATAAGLSRRVEPGWVLAMTGAIIAGTGCAIVRVRAATKAPGEPHAGATPVTADHVTADHVTADEVTADHVVAPSAPVPPPDAAPPTDVPTAVSPTAVSPGPAPPPHVPPDPVPSTDGVAIAALATALSFPLVPIVLGHAARARIRRTGQQGEDMAIAALLIGYCALVFAVALPLLILQLLIVG